MNPFISGLAAFAFFALISIQAYACGGNQCSTTTPGVTQDVIYGASTRFTTDIIGGARGGWAATGAPAQGGVEAFTRGLGFSSTTGSGLYNGSTCTTCGNTQFNLQGTFSAQQEAGVRSHVLQQGNQPGSVEVGSRATTDAVGTGAFRFQNRGPTR